MRFAVAVLVRHDAFAIAHVGQQALAHLHQNLLVVLGLRVTGVALINNGRPQEFEERKGSKVASSCAVTLVFLVCCGTGQPTESG